MGFEALFTIGVLVAATIALALELTSADVILLAALAAVTVAGIVDLDTAVSGFANSTLLALGSLYVVAAALRATGALDRVTTVLLGHRWVGFREVLARMSGATAVSSAFLNNTPIVAMGIPAIRGWAQRHGFNASQLLMPLSFASILGGLCTLIGTSTNLVTDGLLLDHGLEGLGFFELAGVGVPLAVVGILYLIFVAPRLLRRREDVEAAEERRRAALVELEVDDGSPLSGRTVGEVGLSRLPGLDLARIDRSGSVIAPVEKKERLEAGDHLYYEAGPDAPRKRPELTAYPGLRLALRSREDRGESDRELHQAVVKEGSRLVGSTVEEADFLERFNAAVTGVRRGGHRIEKPIGEIVLRPGDVLILDTGRGFREAHEDAAEFFVVSEAGGSARAEAVERLGPVQRLVAGSVLLGIVVLAATGTMHIALAALCGAVGIVVLGLVTPGEARESVDWSVLLVVGAALGLGEAMEASGAARLIGAAIVDVAQAYGPRGVLGGVVLATMILTGLITNNAAAALMFPVALSSAQAVGIDPRPLMIGITISASLSLWTPLGYQTNLMVYGPGNYRFTDFTRVGLPLQIILAVMTVAIVPVVWDW